MSHITVMKSDKSRIIVIALVFSILCLEAPAQAS